MVSADETTFLRDIEKLIRERIPVEIVEGFEPDPNASTEPIKQGQGRNSRPSSKPKAKITSTSNQSSGGRSDRNKNRRRN